jgi:2-polyprenyl-6-methoxyphenol hydroxylase-like FAD-dependent oxidoreductase
MRKRTRRALIIGGSMSGLFAALYLRRGGWEVDVFERSPLPLAGRGAGIMTHPEMRSALSELGIDSSCNFGVPIERRLVLDRAGDVIAQRACPQTATSWNRLFEMLGTAFGGEHYHLGKDLRHAEQAAEGITARFADGTSQTADMLVGADGFRSGARAQLLPEAQPRYAGYVAWRGLADERSLAPVLPRDIFASLVFCLPPGEQFLGYPVAGPGNDLRPGHLSWNIVWYRPADEAAEVTRLLTDESGHVHELSIPPPLVARNIVAEMRAAAERLLPPQFRAVVRCIEQPFLQPIYDLESEAMAFGRAALIGDAAFVVRPHVGAGIVKAARDAAALATALDEHADVSAGLLAFEARRIGEGRKFVAQARRLGSHLKYRFDTEAERAAAAIHADPERMLAETALLDFLREGDLNGRAT